MQIIDLLPIQFDGWSKVGEDKTYTRSTIFDYMDGAGELYLAYDFQYLVVREYTKKSEGSILVELYQMNSSEDAFGIFTHDMEGEEINLGQGAIYSLGLLRFWKNCLFVRLFAERESVDSKSAIFTIASKIVDAVPEGKLPNIVSCLPTDGLIKNSIHYFHKQVSLNLFYYLSESNILNLNENTSAVLARYQINNQKVWVLVVQYQGYKEAKSAYTQFNNLYFSDKPPIRSSKRTEEVEGGKFVSVQHFDKFIVIVFESNNRNSSEAIRKAVTTNLKEFFHEKRR